MGNPIHRLSQRAEQMGLWESLDREEALEVIEGWLAEPSGEFCRCGAELPVFSTQCGICPRCVAAMEVEKSEAEHNLERRMAEMGVPPAYQHCTLESFTGPIPEELLSWVLRPSGFLTIIGADTGVGKSHLGTAALRSLAAGGHRCWWFSAVELGQRLNLEVFDKEQPTWKKSARVEVLMVDDLGAEHKVAPALGEKIDALLDERFQFTRKTIVTTNLTVDQLFSRNARLASRLSEGVVVERGGEDHRSLR